MDSSSSVASMDDMDDGSVSDTSDQVPEEGSKDDQTKGVLFTLETLSLLFESSINISQ
jgi:hypothetical protein